MNICKTHAHSRKTRPIQESVSCVERATKKYNMLINAAKTKVLQENKSNRVRSMLYGITIYSHIQRRW